jgi:hypothetical protein
MPGRITKGLPAGELAPKPRGLPWGRVTHRRHGEAPITSARVAGAAAARFATAQVTSTDGDGSTPHRRSYAVDGARTGATSLAAHLGVIRRRLPLVIIALIVAPAAAVAFSLQQQRLYQASAQVLITNQNNAQNL